MSALSLEKQACLKQCLEDDVASEMKCFRAIVTGPKCLRGKRVASEVGECAQDIAERILAGEAKILKWQKQIAEIAKDEEELSAELDDLERAQSTLARLQEEEAHATKRSRVCH